MLLKTTQSTREQTLIQTADRAAAQCIFKLMAVVCTLIIQMIIVTGACALTQMILDHFSRDLLHNAETAVIVLGVAAAIMLIADVAWLSVWAGGELRRLARRAQAAFPISGVRALQLPRAA